MFKILLSYSNFKLENLFPGFIFISGGLNHRGLRPRGVMFKRIFFFYTSAMSVYPQGVRFSNSKFEYLAEFLTKIENPNPLARGPGRLDL